jgi:hypothetical protein
MQVFLAGSESSETLRCITHIRLFCVSDTADSLNKQQKPESELLYDWQLGDKPLETHDQ